MAKLTIAGLKALWKNGFVPNEGHYADMFDSLHDTSYNPTLVETTGTLAQDDSSGNMLKSNGVMEWKARKFGRTVDLSLEFNGTLKLSITGTSGSLAFTFLPQSIRPTSNIFVNPVFDLNAAPNTLQVISTESSIYPNGGGFVRIHVNNTAASTDINTQIRVHATYIV